jgi:hypothetical protein
MAMTPAWQAEWKSTIAANDLAKAKAMIVAKMVRICLQITKHGKMLTILQRAEREVEKSRRRVLVEIWCMRKEGFFDGMWLTK